MYTVTAVYRDGEVIQAYAVSLEGARQAERDLLELGAQSVTVEGPEDGEEIEQ